MSEAPKWSDTSVEQKKVIPDYFGYYTREVAELLSQNDDFLPLSSRTCQNSEIAGKMQGTVREEDITKHNCNGKDDSILVDSDSVFCDAVGDGVSDIMKERLKALLRQSVVALTGEVDEMLDPVLGICRIQSCLRVKKTSLSCVGATTEGDGAQHHHKKLKLPSSSCSVSLPLDASPTWCSFSGEGKGNEDMDVTIPEKGISNLGKKQCDNCNTTKTPMWRNGPEGTKLCNACGLRFKKGKESLQIKDPKEESFLDLKIEVEKETEEVNDDLQFLLENNDSTVVKTIKKYSDELSTTLEHMEQKLEELLDTVISTCRSLKHAEKIQLRKSIENLPPSNLDRVMEIIGRRKPTEKYSCDEIHVDLENEDNATLWRLYFYVKTVENARKLFELN